MSDSHSSHSTPAGDYVVTDEDRKHMAHHVKAYFVVGALLVVFTAITVGLSYVNFGSEMWNIIVAMVVATFKAGLVAAIFMHLKSEKKTIWRPLIFTMIFVVGMFLLTLLHYLDPIFSTTVTHH